MTRTRWHTDVGLLFMALFWGMNFSVLKYTTQFLAPLTINGVRVPLAAAAQLLVARGLRVPHPSRADVRGMIWLGMLGNGLYQILFISGLARTRVATAALLIAATPAFTAVLGQIRRTELLSRRQWLGVACQLVGCSTVTIGVASAAKGTDSMVGVVLILAACVSWAFYSVQVKRYSDHVPSWYLGGYTMLGGAIVMLVVGLPGMLIMPWTTLPPTVWLALLYSSMVAMVVAYLLYYRGLRVLGPTRTAMYSNLQPMIAMAVAWAALGERPTAPQVTGAAFVIGGLLLTRLDSEPAEA